MNNYGFHPNSKWLCCLLLLITHLHLFAQYEKIAFQKYGVAEGLSENYIPDMIQDDKGFIWLNTQNGLVKYDGYKFQIFKAAADKKDTVSLPWNDVSWGLIKAKDGKIWVGGLLNGIASFDPQTEKFRRYFIDNDSKKIKQIACEILSEDEEGNIWFRKEIPKDENWSICRFNPATRLFKCYSINTRWSNKTKLGTIVNTSNNTWVLDTTGNLCKWNRPKDIFEVFFSAGTPLAPSGKGDTLQMIMKGRGNHVLLTGKHGFYVFDSKSQKVTRSYTNFTGTAIGISSKRIDYAFEDLDGRYWVFHIEGIISLIDPVRDSITTLSYGSGPLSFNKGPKELFFIWVSAENKEGIWLQGFNKNSALLCFLHYNYATKSFRYYDSKFNKKENLLNARFGYWFFQDRTGLLWLHVRDMYKQAHQQMDLFRHQANDPNSLPSDTIRYLFEDSKQRLWIGTRNGLAMRQPGADNFQVYRNDSTNSRSISNNNIVNISEGAGGTIWVGTENGLNQWEESTHSFRRFFLKPKEINWCRPFFDQQQRLWVSVWNKGVFVLDSKTGSIVKNYIPDPANPGSLGSKRIVKMYQDSRGNMWLIGRSDDKRSGLFRLNKSENGFISYGPIPGDSSSISSIAIELIAEDAKKRLWIGTVQGGGINLYDDAHDRFIRYIDPGIPAVTGFAIDPKGQPWFSIYSGEGLVTLDAQSGKITAYGESKGLLHNDLNFNGNIAMDNFGRLWLPTGKGLSVFDPANITFKNYFEKDGFQPYGDRYHEIKTANGDIWIGGQNGLNHIVPTRNDSTLASVAITQVTIQDSIYAKPDGNIFKNAVAYTDAIRLPYWQQDLGFEFVALHYLRSEDNLYSWKLENFDKGWSVPSLQRSASYNNLAPGTYTFLVKAANADGVWNEVPTAIRITILPPWWKTWWANTLYALIFLGALRIFSRWREQKLRSEKEKLEIKVEERTNALKESLDHLQATQSQLIHAEKMASLGELTAGIAHEIQNPLNFVNNFSEVNKELIEELQEERKKEIRDFENENDILNDIKSNEEKISHHGKRADAIVKGMLQHSRSSSGVKEPTDINALADEYLRLAYHGLRAKDKSFNATMKTDFDDTIGKINIIPQDIGRVLLNLINNAFYAAPLPPEGGFPDPNYLHNPTVWVSTKKMGDQVLIIVKDNGPGITQKILDKIFQPFFTTKPTGQGTGLGLSLSYDIVKAHGGEIKVETKEGEGTAFIIQLKA